MTQRAAGLLLHVTSLPGPYGIGDLGPSAVRFLDWARDAGQRLWQVMPLGPTSYHDSPYGCLSAFAGNPLLISPECLVEDGLLPSSALDDAPGTARHRVDFGAVHVGKEKLLREAFAHGRRQKSTALADALTAFREDPLNAHWLPDWCLFAALAWKYPGRAFSEWPKPLVRRQPAALRVATKELSLEIAFHEFVQFVFFSQWDRLKTAANERGIQILGDVPIYVASGSADVWAHPELFMVDESGRPTKVAGVPPDYFSEDGQLWGNPLYRWDRLEADSFGWWIDRMRLNFRLADLVRVDHFRGLWAYWEVPADAKTARSGRWVTGPGMRLVTAIHDALGPVPVIAEDLGDIDDDVRTFRKAAGTPGMKVLQFAFSEVDGEYLPHRHERDCVVYTGTHDNDTARGWWKKLDGESKERVHDYLGTDGRDIHWALIRAAYTSVADRAIVPLQDAFGLGSEARMNTPGRPHGNWTWRATERAFTKELAAKLQRLALLTGRASGS